MSALLGALFSKDIFGIWEIKPWWEKIRAYILYVSLALNFFLVYEVAKPTAVHCTPDDTDLKWPPSKAKLSNEVCAAILPASLTEFPLRSLFLIISTFAIDVLWAMIPRVHRTFETLLRCDKLLSDLTLSPMQIKDIARQIITENTEIRTCSKKEDVKRIEAVCYDLWTLNSTLPVSVAMVYLIRNTICSILTGVSLGSLHSLSIDDAFPCSYGTEYEIMLTCKPVSYHQNFEQSILNCLLVSQWAFALQNVGTIIKLTCFKGYKYVRAVEVYFLVNLTIVLVIIFTSLGHSSERVSNLCLYIRFTIIALPLIVGSAVCIVKAGIPKRVTHVSALAASAHAILEFIILYKFDGQCLRVWIPVICCSIGLEVALLCLTLKELFPDEYENLLQRQKSVIGKEHDNRLALDFVLQSGSPIRPETRAVIFPTELVEGRCGAVEIFIQNYVGPKQNTKDVLAPGWSGQPLPVVTTMFCTDRA